MTHPRSHSPHPVTTSEFAWQARHYSSPRGMMHSLACPGVPWRPRRPLASPGVPWRPLGSGVDWLECVWPAGHLDLSKGSDARPGLSCVPWRPLLSGSVYLEFACQAQPWGSPRGLMYSLASPGKPWVPALFTWKFLGRRGACGSPRAVMNALACPNVS